MTTIITPPGPLAAAGPAKGIQIQIGNRFTVPPTVVDLDSFRAWARSDELPEKARVAWLDGTLWVEPDMEQLYTHNRVKSVFCSVLLPLADARGAGEYCVDGMLLTLPLARVSTVPDGLYFTYAAISAGRLRTEPSSGGTGAVELVGAPEMVLEVVSVSSIDKDMVRLAAAYHQAGVGEFWRVNLLGPDSVFEILRNEQAGWQPTQLPDGWWRSDVFGRDFFLRQVPSPIGQLRVFLDVR